MNMKRRSSRILIIEPFQELRVAVLRILEDNGYSVDAVEDPDDGLKLVSSKRYLIVICRNLLPATSGLRFYMSIRAHLLKTGTAFFLLLKESDKDDFFTGLELGIDNFIFLPLKEDRLIRKIDNQISKIEELDDFRTEKFLNYFNSSPIAMFIIDDNRITKVNKSFESLFGLNERVFQERDFYDLLKFAGEHKNITSYYRLKKGVLHNCSLINLKFPGSEISNFLTVLNKNQGGKQGKILGEIMPLYNFDIDQNRSENSREEDINELVNEDYFVLGHQKSNLTDRELEIYELSAKGLPIKQIASQLNLSMRTVEKHRSNIMRKTNAHNMIEAIRYIQSGPSFYTPDN